MDRLRRVNRQSRVGALRRSSRAIPRRWLTAFLALAVLIAIVKTITLITGRTNPIDRAINVAATPLVVVGRYTAEGFASLGQIFRLPALLRENIRLRSENELLRKTVSETELIRSTNTDLRQALALKKAQFNSVTAQVIARPYDLWLDQVILDVGQNDGVRRGHLVVNTSGVVGIVSDRVEDGLCWVTLVTSPRFRLAAVTGTSQAEGVIRGLDNRAMALEGIRGSSGSVDGNLELMHVKAGAQIKTGEQVLTGGIVNSSEPLQRRPRGQLIGTVNHVGVDPNGALEVRVAPAINPGRINVVSVLTQ